MTGEYVGRHRWPDFEGPMPITHGRPFFNRRVHKFVVTGPKLSDFRWL